MKVIRLQINNFLGVKAVDITPNGNVVKIKGKNGNGKTSVINAIWVAIGGLDKKEVPNDPIRHGEKSAEISVDLGEITVTRKFTGKGEYLEVRSKDGFKAPSPQTLLDGMFNAVSIDPQSFVDMKPKERKELLLGITGNKEKIEQLEMDSKSAYDKRTLVGRDIKTLEGKLVGAPNDEQIEEKSALSLRLKLEEAKEKDRELLHKKDLVSDMIKSNEEHATRIIAIKKEIAELQQEMKECDESIVRNKIKIGEMNEQIESAPPSNTSEVIAEMDAMDEYNAKVRKIKEARALREELKKKEKESDALTAKIKQCDMDKTALLADAKMPVKNISFNGDNMYVGETIFTDMSYSEKIKISMMIGAAINSKIRIIRIARGGELDADSMEQVQKFADKHDLQVWIEQVASEKSQDGLFIEDGEVK
jgi:DNA repair exonuclease SbcCD ATPase subunit